MLPLLHPRSLRRVACVFAVTLWGCAAPTATSEQDITADAATDDAEDAVSDVDGVECVIDGDCAGYFGDLAVCVVAVCDNDTGTCAQADAAGGTSCDDGDTCTQGDVCLAGACLAGAAITCEDANPCTADVCDSATGCVYSFNEAPCDDGDACTVEDVCFEGGCTQGVAVSCDDGNECTAADCDVLQG